MSGPDQVLPAESFITTAVDTPVKLRMGPTSPENRPSISVPSLLTQSCAKRPGHLALAVKRGGQVVTWTYQQFLDEVRTVAKAFIKLGLAERHSVGIIGFNSPEWFIADLAAVFANGVATGIYPTNSAEVCKYIANHCRTNIIVLEDEKQLQKFQSIKNELTNLRAIVQYVGQPSDPDVLSWQQLLDIGKKETDEDLESRLRSVSINKCCHLVYTSGTTGHPKGVMLSHDNLTYTAQVLCDTYEMRECQERIVSYLPLSHVAANITDLFVMVTCVGSTYFADKDALKGTLTTTLKWALPTLFLGVPRVWEKIHDKMVEVGKANKGLKKQIGEWAKRTGLQHNRKRLSNPNQQQPTAGGSSGGASAAAAHSMPSSIKFKIADKIVFQKVKAALGLNKCLRFYSAAAPISPNILGYFLSLDINIFEIYGMSECSGPQFCNTYRCQRMGSIGKTLVGFNSKSRPLDNDSHSTYEAAGVTEQDRDEMNEICMKGRNIMMGYLNNEEKTREAFDDDEWLLSGDLGKTDSDGFVTISGRLKEILITAGGENVAPVHIEDTVKNHLPCISNAMIVGDQRKFLSCLLTFKVVMDQENVQPSNELDDNALSWMEEIGSTAKTVEEALHDEKVREAIQKGIDTANEQAISNAQTIKKWTVLAREFSIFGGELGPTLKMKRHVVLKKYAREIDSMYA